MGNPNEEEAERQGWGDLLLPTYTAEPQRRSRGSYLPRDWVERHHVAVHKPDDGEIRFFDLGPDGRPTRAVCPVCKIVWEYQHGWRNSR